jgi:hypothetical protein
MSNSDESPAKEAGQKVIARALKERRRFRRVTVAVPGRLYIPATQEEAICTVEDISPAMPAFSASCAKSRKAAPSSIWKRWAASRDRSCVPATADLS